MKAWNELKEKLHSERPNGWSSIPDIDLYMDQVLNYMRRQNINGEEALTAAMVNNYMKKDLLPRAKGKKYDRRHIAHLTAICALKQVLSVSDTGALIKEQLEKEDIHQFYDQYCGLLDSSLNETAELIHEEMSREEAADLMLKLAISSYAQKMVCESLLKIATCEQSGQK